MRVLNNSGTSGWTRGVESSRRQAYIAPAGITGPIYWPRWGIALLYTVHTRRYGLSVWGRGWSRYFVVWAR